MCFLMWSFPIYLCILHVEFVVENSKLLLYIQNWDFFELQIGNIISYNVFGMKQKDVSFPVPQGIWSWTAT